jgi:LmbE family N-acetylglucosaminyl deacetylase
MTALRVLAIMPHPDDIEILCAGTLIRLVECGCEVHAATMTPGDKGSIELTREEIAAARRNEAALAANKIGAVSYTCLEFADLDIVFDNESRRRVCTLLRSVDPDIVFTTPPVDYMFDHEITSKLVRDACFNAAVKNYSAGTSLPSSRIPHLYYSDAIGGHNLFGDPTRVQFLIDVSDQMERKTEALACHQSQREWLRRQHGMDDYIESMRNWSRDRGALANVGYAEAFCQHLGHPHPTDNPLIDLLHAIYLT